MAFIYIGIIGIHHVVKISTFARRDIREIGDRFGEREAILHAISSDKVIRFKKNWLG